MLMQVRRGKDRFCHGRVQVIRGGAGLLVIKVTRKPWGSFPGRGWGPKSARGSGGVVGAAGRGVAARTVRNGA